MADFTLNGPGTTNNPWAPPSCIVPLGSLQSSSAGFWPTGFVYSAIAHNVNYGLTITSTATIGAFDTGGDQVYVGAVVRTGANAGCFIGCRFGLNTATVLITSNASGTNTNVSAGATVAATTVGDIVSCTVAIVSGTATLSAKYNGTAVTFTGGTTTTTFASESSLAAGFIMDPQNTNGTKLTQFTGTGVAGGGGGGSNQGLLSLGVALSPLAWIIDRRNKIALERRFEQDQKSRIFLPTYRKSR